MMQEQKLRQLWRTTVRGLIIAIFFIVIVCLYEPRGKKLASSKSWFSKKNLLYLSSSTSSRNDDETVVEKKKKHGHVTLILSADPGDLIGGFGEGSVLYAASEYLGPDPRSKDFLCVSANRISIDKNHVLLVTTGIGATRAALCLDSILSIYGSGIKELIFMGTAGGSPAIGGLIDSQNCNRARPAEPWRITRFGDICVSSFMTNYDCQKCFWSAEPVFVKKKEQSQSSAADLEAAAANLDSACVAAPCSLHDRWDLFGQFACSFFQSPILVQEIIDAANNIYEDDDDENQQKAKLFSQIKIPDAIHDLETKFWQASTGLSPEWQTAAKQRQSDRKPRIHEFLRCAEATSSTYWNGAPYDELARGYIAELINEAISDLNLSIPFTDFPRTRSDVACFSAMEGTGWMSVLRLSELYLKYPNLPAANVRSVSDFTQSPLMYDPPTQLWFENPDWLDEQERTNATIIGYRFAIESASAVILSFFRARKLKKNVQNYPSASADTTFHIDKNVDDDDDSKSHMKKKNKEERHHHHHHHENSPDDDDTTD